MPRCTPEERLVARPCLCDFKDCLADVNEAAAAQRHIVFHLHYDAKTLPIKEAMQRLKEIRLILDAGIAECVDEFRRCRGTDSLPLKPFTPQQKSGFRSASNTHWRHGVAQWIVSTAVKTAKFPHPEVPIVGRLRVASLSIGLFGTHILNSARALQDLADDPTDENFQEVPDPVVINLPEFVVEEGIDEVQVTTLNEWLCNQAKGASLANALVSAINRAQGAEVAGDSEARERQLAAARDFANQWAEILVEAAGLRSMVAVALSNFKIETISISQSELWEIQSEILASGWPEEIIDTLTHFKISDEDQSRVLRKATSVLNYITEVTASLVDNLNDPDFTSQESEVIAVLKEFAMAQ